MRGNNGIIIYKSSYLMIRCMINCDKIINIFRNEEHPIDKALNEILNCTGSYPTGKFEIEINKKEEWILVMKNKT